MNRVRRIGLLCCLLLVTAALPGCGESDPTRSALETYRDVAGEIGLADAPGYGKGVAFIDVNGDGWDDLWDLNTNIPKGKNRPSNSTFYLNQGDGTFEVVDIGIDPEDVQFAWGAAWADFDNDDDPDLLLASGGALHTGNLTLYENRWKQEKRFANISMPAGLTAEKHRWWGASWGDYDNDGCLDFAAVDGLGRAWIYKNGCDKTFTEVAEKLGVSVSFLDGKNPVWLDFDNDGDLDLYIAAKVNHRLYRNDGDAGFTDVTAKLDSPSIRVAQVFAAFATDLNNDGHIDLYLGRHERQDLIALGQPGGTFQIVGQEIGIVTKLYPDTSENTMGLGVGDINDDGYQDIMIGTGGPSEAVFDIIFCGRKQPDSPFGVVFDRCGDFVRAGHGNKQTHGIAVGDLNHDGSTDIFYNLGGAPPYDWKNGTDSRAFNALYSRKPGEGRTATILLKGVDSNRDAIGARIVLILSPEIRFYYDVRSAQGFQSENSRWHLLPLLDKEKARVEIRWPSGRVTNHDVAAGDRTVIYERAESEADASPPSTAPR